MSQSLLHAFSCAFKGIGYVFCHERNFKIHTCGAVLALGAGLLFKITLAEWLAVILCIVAVMALECSNTALEAVVDIISPQKQEKARIAKDCAAGAVLIAAIGSVCVAAFIFLPKIGMLLGVIH